MRLPRLYAPGLSQLILCRFSPTLEERWRSDIPLATFNTLSLWLSEAARTEGVRLHAWSLTPTGLRFIATPPHRQSLSRLVQAVGRRLGSNYREGPVFSGRYRSCLLEPSHWIMPAILWVESTPVFESFSNHPLNWRWSSASEHCGTTRGLITTLNFHHDYWVFGNTPFDRQIHYKAALDEGLLPEQRTRIDAAIQGQWALGSDAFLAGLQPVVSRRATPAARGRPRKVTTHSEPVDASIN